MLKNARQGGTATEAFLGEGEATLGLWLPIALADLYAALVCLMRPWLKDANALTVPSRSETLAGWCLPMLSKSFEAEEKEAAALRLFNSVKNLKEKYGQ